MDDLGGRPHWGKLHFQTAETLAPQYPQWDGSRPCAGGSTPTAASPTATPIGSSDTALEFFSRRA